MKQAGKFIIDVIPITPLSLTRQQFYSYLWETEIPKGTLVSIPFFHRAITGIVAGNRTDFHRFGNIQLKKILKIEEENFLDEKQIKLAQFISDHYFSPLGTVLKSFIPKRVKARKQESKKARKQNAKIKLTQEQQAAVDKIIKNNSKFKIQNSKFLLHGPASSGKTEVYIHSILKLTTNNSQPQFLILLPELTLTPQAIERYGEYFKPEETVILHSKISKGQFYSNWQKIKSGEAKIIIGSRMAVFAPFKKLGLIIIDEEQDMSHKQWDMNPRYDARMVAEKIAELHQCPIVFGSATPRIEDYYKALNGKYGLLKLPRLNLQPTTYNLQPSSIEIIDMKKERWAKNFSMLSKKLKSEIEWTLKNKFQTILFINRQGESAFSVCAGCKSVFRCPACDRALVYTPEGIYKCLHCSFKTDIFPRCQKCQGTSFKQFGIGTAKVEKELKKIFGSARVQRIDSGTIKKSGEQEKVYREFSQGKIDILIGTQMITKGWDLPNVGLIGIIDADSLFSTPDFGTDERAFQHIIQVAGRTNRLGSKIAGTVLIQTFSPEQQIWKDAANMDYVSFYEREIQERQTLSYPPFARLIKITFQDERKEKVEKEMLAAHKQFSEIQKESDFFVSPPLDPLVPKIRGRFRKIMIIKIKQATIPEKLAKSLQKLGKGWSIDVDPISVV